MTIRKGGVLAAGGCIGRGIVLKKVLASQSLECPSRSSSIYNENCQQSQLGTTWQPHRCFRLLSCLPSTALQTLQIVLRLASTCWWNGSCWQLSTGVRTSSSCVTCHHAPDTHQVHAELHGAAGPRNRRRHRVPLVSASANHGGTKQTPEAKC